MTLRRLLLSIALLALVGCSGDDSPTGPDPVATSVEISPDAVTLTAIGVTAQLTAVVRDQTGAVMPGAPLTWSSSSPDRVSVSGTGLVTAVTPGPAMITATSGSALATTEVSVTQVPATVALSPSSLDLQGAGDTATVVAFVSDAGGHAIAGTVLEWFSDDDDVATVDATGLVTAISSGSTAITAQVEGGLPAESVGAAVAGGILTGPSGGQVSAANGAVKLQIPAAALTGPVFITAEPALGLPPGTAPVPGTAFELGPEGLTFGQPVTLTIAYDPAVLPPGVAETELALHKVVGASYEEVGGSSIDTDADLVSGTIQGFSVYAVLRRLRIATTSLPDASVSVPYDALTLAAEGGDGPYSWSIVSGSLPAELTLSPEGDITGTPTAEGTFTFTVQVISGAQSSQLTLSLTVHDLPATVTDLAIVDRSATALTVRFTEVDDGSGAASDYAIRRSISPIEWEDASDSQLIVPGTSAGATREVTIDIPVGSKTSHDVQMVAFRGPSVDDAVFSAFSNVATAPVLTPTGLCSGSPGFAVATFVDNRFDDRVRLTLGLGPDDPITCSLAATIPHLCCISPLTLFKVSDLTGMQNLTGLESFLVEEGPIEDLSPMAGLEKLRLLHFRGVFRAGSTIDLEPLAGLTGLTSLRFASSPGVTDIGPLQGLQSLETLVLFYVGVTDIAPLQGLPSLETLELTHVDVTDFGPLQSLTALTDLTLDRNDLSDLSPLSALTNLTSLSLGDDPYVKDIQPLLDNSGLGEADRVDLRGTSVSCADVEALQAKGVVVTHSCLRVATTSLPDGEVGASYAATLTLEPTTWGDVPPVWSLASGSAPLPPGLGVSAGVIPGRGQITGTPTEAGSWTFVIDARDPPESALSRNAQQTLTIDVEGPPGPPVGLSTSYLVGSYPNAAYADAIAPATGGNGTYTYLVTDGVLPAGLSLDSGTGVISGTSTLPGVYFFEVTATSAGQAASATYAITVSTVGSNEFNLWISFNGGPIPPANTGAALNNALARWEEIVLGDVGDQTYPPSGLTSGTCGLVDASKLNGAFIDDVVILMSVAPIDGASGILARAGPCGYGRGTSPQVISGQMQLDEADAASASAAYMELIVWHEIGHVMGIGTLWHGLLSESGTAAPRYVGVNGSAEWLALGGAAGGPYVQPSVEAHWHEAWFNSEIMTPTTEGPFGAMPISRVTIATLMDLGWTVDLNAADVYTLPGCAGSCSLSAPEEAEPFDRVIVEPLLPLQE